MIGWLASIFGSIYPIPQAYKSIKNKHSFGISRWFLLLWSLDKFFTLYYVYDLQDVPLIIKYSVGLICVAIVSFYKISGKK